MCSGGPGSSCCGRRRRAGSCRRGVNFVPLRVGDWGSVVPGPAIGARLHGLQSTTFAAQRLTRRMIAEIQETVELLLSRTELAQTVCEHRGWRTPCDRSRLRLGMRVLEGLEQEGILTLPARRHDGPRPNRPARLAAGASGDGHGPARPRGVEGMGREVSSARLPEADRGLPSVQPAGVNGHRKWHTSPRPPRRERSWRSGSNGGRRGHGGASGGRPSTSRRCARSWRGGRA